MMGDLLLLGAGRGGYGAGGGGGGGGGEVTYTVSSSLDDGYFRNPNENQNFPATFSWSLARGESVMSFSQRFQDDDGGSYLYQKGYFRFQNINIAQGTTIQSAFFKPIFKSGFDATGTMTIVATNLDNVAAPSASSDGNTSLHTSAEVAWVNPPDPPDNNSTIRRTSPDIKTVIQEVVDRSGWSAGNAIMIQTFFGGNNSTYSAGSTNIQRTARTYDDDTGGSEGDYAAQLVITT